MKSFALATMAAAGLLCSTGTADAQFRSRGYRGQSYQTYSYPTYTYPGAGYVMPGYYGSSYAPTYYDGGIVTSGYTVTDPGTAVADLAGSYLNQVLPGAYTPSYAYPSTYWGYSSYGGYSYPTYYGRSSRGLFGRRR